MHAHAHARTHTHRYFDLIDGQNLKNTQAHTSVSKLKSMNNDYTFFFHISHDEDFRILCIFPS